MYNYPVAKRGLRLWRLCLLLGILCLATRGSSLVGPCAAYRSFEEQASRGAGHNACSLAKVGQSIGGQRRPFDRTACASQVKDEPLQRLSWSGVESVFFPVCGTDKALVRVLDGCQLTPSEIASLGKIESVFAISLENEKMSSEFIHGPARSENLFWLSIVGRRDSADLRRLKKFPSLQALTMFDAELTDKAVAALGRLPSLKMLKIVTDSEEYDGALVEKLRNALPHVAIAHWPYPLNTREKEEPDLNSLRRSGIAVSGFERDAAGYSMIIDSAKWKGNMQEFAKPSPS